MFCHLFWNPDCPFFSPLSGNSLKFYDLLPYNTSPVAERTEDHQKSYTDLV